MNPQFAKRHIMLDLETMGTRPGCPVLSIGAVIFTPEGIEKEFYVKATPLSNTSLGLVASQATLDWWAEQSEAARAEAFEGATLSIGQALSMLDDWVVASDVEHMWCHGATFDAPILDAIYDKLGRPAPWKFYNVRDTRTLYDLSGIAPDRTKGMHHHALTDARNQAEAAVKALKVLGLWV